MSQHSNPGVTTNVTAAADLPVRRFIGVDGNLCGAGAQPIGVSYNETDSGEECAVIVTGIAVVEASAAISAGALVQSTSTGKAVTMTAPTDAVAMGKAACGVALEASTADGQFIRVKLL